MKMTKFACAVLCVVMGVARAEQPFELVVGEKDSATVVVPAKAEESTVWAAEMLQQYVEKITGRKLEVKSQDQERKGPAIIIGTLATLKDVPADIVEKLKGAKQYEASFTRVTDDTIWIVGKESPGEHYAVNHFLETRCGVTWFTVASSEDPGELVPQQPSLVFKTGDLFREPAFWERRLSMVGAVWYPIPTNAMEICFRDGFQPMISKGYPHPSDTSFWRNAFSARWVKAHCSIHKCSVGGGHNLFNNPVPGHVKPTKENGNFSGYFETHPEYFPLVKGQRVDNGLHCFSNPDVQRIVAEAAIKKLDTLNGDGFFLFGMTDQTYGWCECEACRKLDPPGTDYSKGGTPDVSTRFTHTANAIAEMIYKKYPHADLHRWAYHTYRNRPVGVEDDPRFKIQYCAHGRCFGHRLDDPNCARNKPYYAELKAWLDAPNAGGMLYDYLLANSDDWYACEETREADDIRLYRKMGIIGWKNEMNFSGSNFVGCDAASLPRRHDYQLTNWRYFYVVGRLLWNPDLDVEAMLLDVDKKFYGKAAAPMIEYQQIRRKLWKASTTCFGYPWGNPRTPQLMNDLGAKERLFKLLDDAAKLAADDKVLARRIAEDRRWLETYWVRPNTRLRERMGSELKAPFPLSPVTLDGKGDEPAWAGAFYTDAFKRIGKGDEHDPIPAALKTSVGILADKENFYFLVTAKEPHPEKMQLGDGKTHPAWWGDHVEFFLFPPNVENKYYQVAINTAGVKYTAVQPSGKLMEIAVEAKSTIADGVITMEVKVPVAGMNELKPGDSWRLHICRMRGFEDEVAPKTSWTLDGTGFHTSSEYRQIEIGSAFLANGSFDDVDKDGKLLGWETKVSPANETIARGVQQVKREGAGGQALRIVKGLLRQHLNKGPFAMSDKPRKLEFQIKAKGPGDLNVTFWRFTEIPKHRRVDPHGKGGSFKLTPEWKTYEGAYTIQPNEVVYFVIDSGGTTIEVDDLVVLSDE